MGPLSQWVDDHFFFRILCMFLTEYNERRQQWAADIAAAGQHQDGGRLWYGGRMLEGGVLKEFDEDCRFPFRDLSTQSNRSVEDQQYTYNFDDIDRLSDQLGIPWELSKDTAFASIAAYIGFEWDLDARTVTLTSKKKAKYILAIQEWRTCAVHTLNEVQKLYGKLLHTCLVVPRGRAYLTGLEAMLSAGNHSPFVPHSPAKGVHDDLAWWTDTLSQDRLARPIPGPVTLREVGAFSDASSGIGVGIIIRGRWRAWHLIPGWQTLDGAKDIGWAEAVGFELMARSIIQSGNSAGHFQTYGDNEGVVGGWRNGRSRNRAVNKVFRRLHDLLHDTDGRTHIHISYVPSKLNPADAPSRGIFPSRALLFPPIPLPADLERFLVDATLPYTAIELHHLREGKYPTAVAKSIRRAISISGVVDHEAAFFAHAHSAGSDL